MKRIVYAFLFCLLLSACGAVKYPDKAADGADWNPEWLMHANLLGIEPSDAFPLVENYAVLTMNGITTSVWNAGETTDGEQYPAQIYVLVKECADAAEADENAADWAARLSETWSVTDAREAEYNAQSYAVLDCQRVSEDSPYARELAALTCYASWAVIVELDCTDEFDGDADAILSDFLGGCHYNAALQN